MRIYRSTRIGVGRASRIGRFWRLRGISDTHKLLGQSPLGFLQGSKIIPNCSYSISHLGTRCNGRSRYPAIPFPIACPNEEINFIRSLVSLRFKLAMSLTVPLAPDSPPKASWIDGRPSLNISS